MTSESVNVRDLIVAVFRHYRSRLRRRFIKADTAVWRVSDEIDFARWQRQVNQPNTPEIEAWIGSGELDLDGSEFRTVTLH